MILDRRGLVAVGGTSYGVVEETNCCRSVEGFSIPGCQKYRKSKSRNWEGLNP